MVIGHKVTKKWRDSKIIQQKIPSTNNVVLGIDIDLLYSAKIYSIMPLLVLLPQLLEQPQPLLPWVLFPQPWEQFLQP